MTNSKIFGVLMDDYYMHEIHLQQNNDLYVFGTKFILKNNQKLFSWKSKVFYRNDENPLDFQILNNKININLIKNQTNFRFTIVKLKNELVGCYLDILFDNLNGRYERYDGLMGYIGKQQYTLKTPVQNENISSMLVNNSLINVQMRRRSGGMCWLIQLKDILSQQKINQFISFQAV